jgi:hypothetical protein
MFKTLIVSVVIALPTVSIAQPSKTDQTVPAITVLNPLEQDFFSKKLFYNGIPIKSSQVVSDEALKETYRRISRLLDTIAVKQPMLISNLIGSGVEMHIIGQHQVTSDLPEFRELKGKPLPEYNGLTIDQRTRGMGGQLSSCGEENLLKLKDDRYLGRDICMHEFSHAIRNNGMPINVVAIFDQQYQRSLDKGLWKGSYAASNPDEFFSELTMWYFGTHGDMNMTGVKPADGPDGLKAYDPEAYALLDDFYNGRIHIGKMDPGGHEWTYGTGAANKPADDPKK